ncbi:MAG: hypothetical protein LBQ50_02715 [Planctomycetaceae bacterium]|jgi:hypothetical protein|nr:hypothetical protein [Planctomycetaceae bacterium]
MYRGFKLKLSHEELKNLYRGLNSELSLLGATIAADHLFSQRRKQMFGEMKKSVECAFRRDGTIDGTKLQENWFPQIDAHIFISHSHQDEKLAIRLAGWLHKTFGLDSFIDSCLWGYSKELQRHFDKIFSWLPLNGFYDYSISHLIADHIHTMLTMALAQMIDNTECLIFLNTHNSIPPNKTIEQTFNKTIQETFSPWIYAEIQMSRLARSKTLNEYRECKSNKIAAFSLPVNYPLDTSHLTNLEFMDLCNWEQKYDNALCPLDILYKLKQE